MRGPPSTTRPRPHHARAPPPPAAPAPGARQARPDQSCREIAGDAVDDGDGAADASGGNELAVAGCGERDDRSRAGLDLVRDLAGVGQQVDLAVGAGGSDFTT